MADQLIRRDGCDRRLKTDPPSPDYRLLGWHCIYHEQAGRLCHNQLDCDLVPIWALSVDAGLNRMSTATEVPKGKR